MRHYVRDAFDISKGTGELLGVGGMVPTGGQGGGGEWPSRHPFGDHPFSDKKLGNPSPTTPQSQHSDPQPQPNSSINHQQPNPEINQQQPNSQVNHQQSNPPKASPVPTISSNAVDDQNAKIKTPASTQRAPGPSTNTVKHSNSSQNDNGLRHNGTTSTSGGSFRNVGCNGLTIGIVTIMMMSLWTYGMALKIE